MTAERFLVTGASGCIGAWVVRRLVRQNVATAAMSMSGSLHRLRLILNADELAQVHFIRGDVADLDAVVGAVEACQPTHVIHLAALQLPFCKADPVRGAWVNVVGTVNVFEAVKRSGLRRVVYASSMAVYGRSEEYAPAPLSPDAVLKPRSHYGVYKQANEGSARLYWSESGISSIGLRPYVVYGPGRDQGMTSTPTKAMLAAAAGRSYRISYGGRFGFEYADDVPQAFIRDGPQLLRRVLMCSTPPGIRLICQRSSGPLSMRNPLHRAGSPSTTPRCHSRPRWTGRRWRRRLGRSPRPSGQRRG